MREAVKGGRPRGGGGTTRCGSVIAVVIVLARRLVTGTCSSFACLPVGLSGCVPLALVLAVSTRRECFAGSYRPTCGRGRRGSIYGAAGSQREGAIAMVIASSSAPCKSTTAQRLSPYPYR